MADESPSRTIQQYLDEHPIWADGTPVATVALTAMQWRVWILACAGKFFEGMVVFTAGVALPLISVEFNLDATQKGLVSAASLFGILVGATALGGLADRFGRKAMFISEMALFVVFLVLVLFAPGLPWLLTALFGLGVALGCDYPTAHMVISESIPSQARGRLVLGAFAFQAVGALAGTAIGLIVLQSRESVNDWRLMYATAIVPAMIVTVGRFFIPDSPHWLLSRGRIAEAETETAALLQRHPPYPKHVVLRRDASETHAASGYAALFAPHNRRATLLASIPWFLQDLGTYGIGIFTPTILAATIGEASPHPRNLAEVIHNDVLGTRGAALIDFLLLVGIIAAVLLADRVGRIRLQIFGFLGCAVGLFIAALADHVGPSAGLALIFAGFMLFNFMTNIGPNAMTYLIAGEVFPTRVRGIGAGFAASVGKVGAVLTSFFFPILLHRIGTPALLAILIGAYLLGAWVTWLFRIETTGLNLETLGEPAAPAPP